MLDEFQRFLEGHPFRILTCRLERAARQGELRIPRASIYVVDSAGRQEAEFLLAELLDRFSAAPVLVLVERLEETAVSGLLRMGAKGVLRYSDVEAQLARALETLAQGGFWAPRSLLSRFIDETVRGSRRRAAGRGAPSLSRREREVKELLLENLANKEIGRHLHVSERTVKFHVSNLLSKHGVKRRADLILLSYRGHRPI